MAGPGSEAEALAWIQEAVTNARYIHDPHIFDRCRDRNLDIRDVKHAIANAAECRRYQDPDRPPVCGGTQWSVLGPSLDGDEIRVGVDAFLDHLGRRVVLVSVMGA